MVWPLVFGSPVSCKLCRCSTMQPFSKPQFVEADRRRDEVVLTVREHEVTVFEGSCGMHCCEPFGNCFASQPGGSVLSLVEK